MVLFTFLHPLFYQVAFALQALVFMNSIEFLLSLEIYYSPYYYIYYFSLYTGVLVHDCIRSDFKVRYLSKVIAYQFVFLDVIDGACKTREITVSLWQSVQ